MEYLKSLPRGVRNPYVDYGYALIFEEIDKPITSPRLINYVRVCCDVVSLDISGPLEEVVTVVDLLFHILNFTNFKSPEFDTRSYERGEIYDTIKKLPSFNFSFLPSDEFDHLEFQHTLIYVLSSKYEDSYYRKLMLESFVNVHE